MQETLSRPDRIQDRDGDSRRILELSGTGERQVAVVATPEGGRLHVPLQRITRHRDRWTLSESWAELRQAAVAAGDEVARIPVVEERVQVAKRTVERGKVRIHKRVEQTEETVDVPLTQESLQVERVPIGQYVEEAPQVREDGDVLVVPCVEEVLVVEKRLLLREELRVRRTRAQTRQPRTVTLRKEVAEVERLADEEPPLDTDPPLAEADSRPRKKQE